MDGRDVDGTLWFKENCPPHRAEGTVHTALARLAPDRVDAPVAVHRERGWLLTRDGGPTVADAGATDPETFKALLRDYAALQRQTMEQRDALVDAGLRVAVPQQAVETARAQAMELHAYPADDPRHITAAQRDTVLQALPALAEAAARLADGPLALDQSDVHPRNVFLPTSSSYRFFDFADAAWAHPFGSLLLIVTELERRRGPAGAERTSAVVDAYLLCWTDLAPLDELRELAQDALRLAPLHRSAAWFRILGGADPAAIERHGRTPWAWLQDVAKPVL